MKFLLKFNKFWSDLNLGEKFTFIGVIIIPLMLFVYSEIKNFLHPIHSFIIYRVEMFRETI